MASPHTDIRGVGGHPGTPAVTLQRSELVQAVGAAAARYDMALFVGNGYLIRETARSADGPNAFYLFGGMGLASSVAHGYCRATGRPALVLEGDGNFLMGLGGAACAPAIEAGLVHVVAFNGVYESSGGQPMAIGAPEQVVHTALGLGYRAADVVTSVPRLRARLDQASRRPGGGASMICAATSVPAPAPPRPDMDARECRERFTAWGRHEER
ncbi:thiamine pyrophosphate-dependent enzyme [Actinomadura rubrisoli]|uniref:Thiamine pyrophosphate enzyme TPP-binding domain-containing protein n=1 Tax=Actinomadura rubrisoli TaxID=2530368 RepID=A0A4R5BEL8_9ACTN|nr:thiamine pyrophosphate-dependent enzyme [Actinomadura rubrisoli]TDD85028.1 hypothetical protein E1298_19145 [Actinomadura rubrisoli]